MLQDDARRTKSSSGQKEENDTEAETDTQTQGREEPETESGRKKDKRSGMDRISDRDPNTETMRQGQKKEGEDKEGLLSQLVLPVGKQALFPQSGVFSLDTKKITKEVDILLFMEDQVFFQIFVLI